MNVIFDLEVSYGDKQLQEASYTLSLKHSFLALLVLPHPLQKQINSAVPPSQNHLNL